MEKAADVKKCCHHDESSEGNKGHHEQQVIIDRTPDLCDYASPLEAFKNAPPEKIVYVSCINPRKNKPDYLAVIDVDDKSENFCKVIHRVYMPEVGDELHHYGWNHCTGCREHPKMKRSHLLMPALNSGKVHVINTIKDERKPTLEKSIDLASDAGITFPHTVHCLPNGKVLISLMGDEHGNASGNFAILDGDTFKYEGKWSTANTPFGYDFWYKPRLNVLFSTSWGPPAVIKNGFKPEEADQYGHFVYVYDYSTHELTDTIDLGFGDGSMALEIRMTHDPSCPHGYVITGLGSSLYHFWKDPDTNKWKVEKVDQGDKIIMDGSDTTPALFTDSVISMDDKFLYVSAWYHGYIRQYDISNKSRPKMVSQIPVGQATLQQALSRNPLIDTDGKENKQKINGGPQMLQLSLDGKRLYVTDSLYSVWDQQFYPNLVKKGATLLRINVDHLNGGMKLDENFSVAFGQEPDGPVLAHEIRYPGGDCTSDIFI